MDLIRYDLLRGAQSVQAVLSDPELTKLEATVTQTHAERPLKSFRMHTFMLGRNFALTKFEHGKKMKKHPTPGEKERTELDGILDAYFARGKKGQKRSLRALWAMSYLGLTSKETARIMGETSQNIWQLKRRGKKHILKYASPALQLALK